MSGGTLWSVLSWLKNLWKSSIVPLRDIASLFLLVYTIHRTRLNKLGGNLFFCHSFAPGKQDD